MRIGLFTPLPVSRSIGATKNRVEFAEALGRLGWDAEVFGAEEIGAGATHDRNGYEAYQRKLREFLCQHHDRFDIALVEADTLPFPRETLPPDMLIVARPAMVWVHHHLIEIPTPDFSVPRRMAQRVKGFVRRNAAWTPLQRRGPQRQTCQSVDLVHALTQWDADALQADGVRRTTFEVIPNGIHADRAHELRAARHAHDANDAKSIVFVGSFDYRKGCLDIAEIMSHLWAEDEQYRLTLLGAKGLFQSEQQIRAHFPAQWQHQLEVVMRFDNAQLPDLMARQSIGLFPSYVEGFPFGCLEMIASGLPTVAYRSPGAECFVPDQIQVTPGDVETAVALIRRLASDPDFYSHTTDACLEVAARYDWDRVAADASNIYERELRRRRGQPQPTLQSVSV